MGVPRDPIPRFWAKVNKTDGCWYWTGANNGRGYGVFQFDGRQGYAHRFAYITFVGPIADGLVIDHLCREHSCVRPDHLEAVTNTTNLVRGEGPTLAKARRHTKTHCVHGHPYDEANTYIEPSTGNRICRTCIRAKLRRENSWRVVKNRERRHAKKRLNATTEMDA